MNRSWRNSVFFNTTDWCWVRVVKYLWFLCFLPQCAGCQPTAEIPSSHLWICVLGWAVLRHCYSSFNRRGLTAAIVISSFLSVMHEKPLHPNAPVISHSSQHSQYEQVKNREFFQTRKMFLQYSHFLCSKRVPSITNTPTLRWKTRVTNRVRWLNGK